MWYFMAILALIFGQIATQAFAHDGGEISV